MAIIRKYRQTDYEQLKQLWIELQAHELTIYAGRAKPTISVVDHIMNELLANVRQKQGAIVVADEDGTLCGFAAGYIDEDLENTANKFLLEDLIVSEKSRGKNLGTQLVQAIEHHAKSIGQSKIGLPILVGNTNAYNLYKKLGFKDYTIEMIKNI